MRLLVSRSAMVGLAAAALCGAGCDLGEPRESKTVTRSVTLDKAESVDIEVTMGAGELQMSGGASKLLDANFRFNVPEWEPVVDYQGAGARGTLRIKQPSSTASFRRTENKWDLKFTDGVPIDMTARLGAGEARLALGSLDLRTLEIHEGAGELQLDLRGTPKHSYEVRVNGGVGRAHVRVPRSVGITATAVGGLGSVSVQGLEKRGDTWVNPQHENDAVTIRLSVKGGIGEIIVSAE